jgi:flagellar motility protein MotE (MotC chaperone)
MFKFFKKVRVIPVVIFAGVLMLSFKVGDIVGVLQPIWNTLSVSKVYAQVVPPTESLDKNSRVGSSSPARPNINQPAQTVKTGKDVEDPKNDPTLFSQSEINLLQQLARRRDTLEARSEELTLREGLLGAAEKRIEKKILEMKALELAIQKLIRTHDQQEDLKILSLVKIYESMKPKDAARIFQELDINTLLLVSERMKEKKLAAIMSKMNPERAKEMTVALTKIRNLPNPGT